MSRMEKPPTFGDIAGERRETGRTVAVATVGVNPARCHGRAMTEYTTVSIPKELAARVDDTIEGTTFSSTSDLVRFLLRSIVIQHERSGGDLSESEFQEIAEQLTDLGYLR